MSELITITANGEVYTLADRTPLAAFLENRGQAIERVVVERNGEALSPSEARTVRLADGDRLEVVRIVAGG